MALLLSLFPKLSFRTWGNSLRRLTIGTSTVQGYFSGTELRLESQLAQGPVETLWLSKLSPELAGRLGQYGQDKPQQCRRLLERLGQMDLAPLVQKLSQSQARYWSRSRLCRALETYVCFLLDAALQPEVPLTAVNGDMDAVWHCHILQTQKYTQDCLAVFGHYLHHDAIAPGACNINIHADASDGPCHIDRSQGMAPIQVA